MKEIIIRMKDMSELYGPNFDPEEVRAEHTGLEVELEGIIYDNVAHLNLDITPPTMVFHDWEKIRDSDQWKCDITMTKHIPV